MSHHSADFNTTNESGTGQSGSAPFAPAPAPVAHVNLDRCRLSLIKGEHRWRFRWEPGSEAALISAVADLARDPRSGFDWFDATVVCRHIARPPHVDNSSTNASANVSAAPASSASSAHRATPRAAHISPVSEKSL